jgi:hypothetical protein
VEDKSCVFCSEPKIIFTCFLIILWQNRFWVSLVHMGTKEWYLFSGSKMVKHGRGVGKGVRKSQVMAFTLQGCSFAHDGPQSAAAREEKKGSVENRLGCVVCSRWLVLLCLCWLVGGF